MVSVSTLGCVNDRRAVNETVIGQLYLSFISANSKAEQYRGRVLIQLFAYALSVKFVISNACGVVQASWPIIRHMATGVARDTAAANC